MWNHKLLVHLGLFKFFGRSRLTFSHYLSPESWAQSKSEQKQASFLGDTFDSHLLFHSSGQEKCLPNGNLVLEHTGEPGALEGGKEPLVTSSLHRHTHTTAELIKIDFFLFSLLCLPWDTYLSTSYLSPMSPAKLYLITPASVFLQHLDLPMMMELGDRDLYFRSS